MNVVIFNHSGAQQVVAGLTLAKRAHLTAQHWGATNIDIITDAQTLSGWSPGPTLIMWGHVVYEKSLFDDVSLKEHMSGGVPCIWTQDNVPLPLLYMDGSTLDATTMCALLDASDHAQTTSFLQQLKDDHTCQSIELDAEKNIIVVIDKSSAATATHLLWESCRKPIDGIVSTHINRHISLFISKRLVNTSITPNQISVFCILLGIGSGVAVAFNTPMALILGAILLKLNSIIDGVDGELARVKWAYSKFGEWLDAAGDNVTNFSFFGALTYVMWARQETVFFLFGATCLAMWLTHLVFVYSQLYKMKRGDVLLVRQNLDTIESGVVQKVIDVLRYKILRRDSFVMLAFVLVLLGQPGPLLVIMCLGASIAFFGVLMHGFISLGKLFKPQPA